MSEEIFMAAVNQGYGDIEDDSDSADHRVAKKARRVAPRSRRLLFNGGEPAPVSFQPANSGTATRQAAAKATEAMKGMK